MTVAIGFGTLLARPAASRAANVLEQGWDLSYTASDGDGTRVTSAYYQGTKVFARLDLPFIFVTYAETPYCCTDQLGSDVRVSGPTKTSYSTYFEIVSTYCFSDGNCNNGFSYKYVERYRFYGSGQLQLSLDIYGPGIYPTALYEVFWRVDFDITDSGGDNFEQWSDGAWKKRTSEGNYCDDGSNNPSGREWRQIDFSPTRHYSVLPYSYGLFYCDLAVRYHSGEFGASAGDHPYPTSYVNGESIDTADVVQWWWGKRNYARPAGCGSDGTGCTTPYTIYFAAYDNGY